MTKSMETQAFSLRLVQGPRTAKTIAYRLWRFPRSRFEVSRPQENNKQANRKD